MDARYVVVGAMVLCCCSVINGWKLVDPVEPVDNGSYDVRENTINYGKENADNANDALQVLVNDLLDAVIDARQAQELLIQDGKGARKNVSHPMEPNVIGGQCQVQGMSVQCCASGHIVKVTIKVCLSLTFVSPESGMKIKLTAGGVTIISKSIPVRDPPPICVKVPLIKSMKKTFKVCLGFYDLNISAGSFKACANVKAKASLITADFKLGCFTIPLKNIADKQILEDRVLFDAWVYKQKQMLQDIK